MDKHRILESAKKAVLGVWNTAPILVAIVLLLSLTDTFLDSTVLAKYIGNANALGPIIGALAGSVFAGNPITSYVMGGELGDSGVGIAAIAAFMLCWVTVGVVQFPAEAILLGKKFAIVRNISAFFFSLAIAFILAVVVGA